MTRVPLRLERPPLVEAVLEVRFIPLKDSVGDILPGLLYGKLKHLFDRTEALPISAVPRELRLSPELRYRPHIRLVGENQALLVGDHVVTISRNPPYSGWESFRALCQEVLEVVRTTELLESLERFAFKCVNILDLAGRHPVALLNADLRLGDYEITDRGLRLRTEIDYRGYISIVEIASVATVDVKPTARTGLLLSIDTLRTVTSAEFWADVPTHIDSAHAVLKEMFFGMLKEEVVNEYGPTWK